EAAVIGIRPQADAVVAGNQVVGDGRAVDLPELAAAGAAAPGAVHLPVIGVVPGDLIVLNGDVGGPGGIWRVGVEAVLLIVREAAGQQFVVAAEHHPGAGVLAHSRVVDRPVRRGVVVHYALVRVAAPGSEVLDREVADRHVRGVPAERVGVDVLAVEDGAGRADEGGAVARHDLRVDARTEHVLARCEPVRRAGRAEVHLRVIAGRDGDRARGRHGGSAEFLLSAAYRLRGGRRVEGGQHDVVRRLTAVHQAGRVIADGIRRDQRHGDADHDGQGDRPRAQPASGVSAVRGLHNFYRLLWRSGEHTYR